MCCVFAAEQDCAENRDRGNAGKYKIHNTRIHKLFYTHGLGEYLWMITH